MSILEAPHVGVIEDLEESLEDYKDPEEPIHIAEVNIKTGEKLRTLCGAPVKPVTPESCKHVASWDTIVDNECIYCGRKVCPTCWAEELQIRAWGF